MFTDNKFKLILNVILLFVIFLSLCYYFIYSYPNSSRVVECLVNGKINKKRQKRQKRQKNNLKKPKINFGGFRKSKAAKLKALKRKRKEKKNKKFQKNIRSRLISGIYGNDTQSSANITNCAVAYSDSLQLGKSKSIFNIFGKDKIIKCVKKTPTFVSAKKDKLPSGITLTSLSDVNDHIHSEDMVRLCGNDYKISSNESVTNGPEKIKYGDNINFEPLNSKDTSFNVTVNPNVYGLPNLKSLKSSDFSRIYQQRYSFCGDSDNIANISAKN